jgi:hypothetical protein
MYNNIVQEGNVATEKINVHPRAPRLVSHRHKMEEYAQHMALHHFLLEETMVAPNAACFIVTQNVIQRNVLTDKEYLGSACIGLCHDLANHCVTPALNVVDNATAVPFIKR